MSDFIIDAYRFGGAFSPEDFSPSAWFEADSLGLANGAAVASWTDLSANANHATQATAGNRPIYRTNVVNGHAAVEFVSSDWLVTTVGTVLTNASDRSWAAFAVVKADLLSGVRMIVSQQNASGSAHGPQFLRTNGTALQTVGNQGSSGSDVDSASTVLATGTWYIMEAFEAGSLLTALVDGAGGAGTVSGPLQNYNDQTDIGSFDSGNSLFWDGHIAEIIIYPSDLTSGDRTDVRDYLTDKYAI